jgi:hypothetical protein
MDKYVLKNVIDLVTKTTNLLMTFIFILVVYLHILRHVHVLPRVFPWICFSVHDIYFWQQAANIHTLASPCLFAVEYCLVDFLEL